MTRDKFTISLHNLIIPISFNINLEKLKHIFRKVFMVFNFIHGISFTSQGITRNHPGSQEKVTYFQEYVSDNGSYWCVHQVVRSLGSNVTFHSELFHWFLCLCLNALLFVLAMNLFTSYKTDWLPVGSAVHDDCIQTIFYHISRSRFTPREHPSIVCAPTSVMFSYV